MSHLRSSLIRCNIDIIQIAQVSDQIYFVNQLSEKLIDGITGNELTPFYLYGTVKVVKEILMKILGIQMNGNPSRTFVDMKKAA